MSDKTNITKSQRGREVYRLDGEIKNKKIDGKSKIKREYKVTKTVEINLNFTKNENIADTQNLEMEIKDTNLKNNFHKSKYVYRLKTRKFNLEDKKEGINVKDKESIEITVV